MALIELRKLNKIYANGVHALVDVDLTVQEGEFLVVIGLSGSGKSTLLRCINRLIEPTSGQILYRGQDVTHIQGQELRQYRKKIGMIFQQFNLIKRRTVLLNVLTGALGSLPVLPSILERFPDNLRQEAMEKLRIVGLEDKWNVRVDALSGGQQQRVAIARSLMQHPEVLLADEPVASLDPATSHSVMKYLKQLNTDYGMTIICNLHFLSLVRTYGTRVVALKQGKLIFQGKPEEITQEWFKEIYGEEAEEVEIA